MDFHGDGSCGESHSGSGSRKGTWVAVCESDSDIVADVIVSGLAMNIVVIMEVNMYVAVVMHIIASMVESV